MKSFFIKHYKLLQIDNLKNLGDEGKEDGSAKADDKQNSGEMSIHEKARETGNESTAACTVFV